MKRESEIAELFAAVSELEPNAQDVFLKEKCDDVFLREEIEELLGSFGKAQKNSFMSASALEIEAEYLTEIEESDSRINEVIGRYKILEKIGAGGMGAIYLAARTDDFQKRVAVKIVKRGMDSDAILRRFRNERQILANLEHPNVARLIDAGTTADGLPFFVMEYVAGKPVNLYCQEHNLTIEQRLDLFRQICAAVEFAHRKIIVHRDLKPSNILVTEDGVPKLLDFGIAKLLDSSNEDETKTNQRVLTPAYASPEQINGEKIITPATDVYSLGVILYELLTGNRPFPATQDGLDKTKRINSEPARPSLVLSGEKSFGVKTSDENATVGGERKSKSLNAKSLRGNLDNIVLKAMRREPERRYQTAAEFSEDIERHLKNLPVRARPATVSYRVSSFARRNRSLVTIVAVAVFALTLFAGVSAFQYLRGQRQLGELQKMNENLTAAVASGSSIQARTDLARATVEQLNALSSGVGGDANLRVNLAKAYLNLGDLQGKPFTANIGDTEGAKASYEKAIELLSDSHKENEEAKRLLALTQESYGYLLGVRFGRWNDGHEIIEKAVAIREEIYRKHPTEILARQELAAAYSRLGDMRAGLKTPLKPRREFVVESLPLFYRSLELREELFRENSGDLQIKRDLAQSCERYGFRLFNAYGSAESNNREKTLEAVAYMEKSLSLRKEIVESGRATMKDSRNLADQYLMTGIPILASGKTATAIENFRRSREMFQTILFADLQNVEASRDMANALYWLGVGLTQDGKKAEAREQFLAAQKIVQNLLSREHTKEDSDLLKGIEDKMKLL